VAAPPAPVAPPPAEPARTGLSGRRIGAIVSFGIGGAGLVMGAVTGGLAIGKKSTVNEGCGIGGDPTACNAAGFSAASSLKTLGAASTAGFGISGRPSSPR